MKNTLTFLCLILSASLYGAANDVIISQRNSGDTGNTERRLDATGEITDTATFAEYLGLATSAALDAKGDLFADGSVSLTGTLVPAVYDLTTGTVIDPTKFNTNDIAANKTFTFGTIELNRPFYLRISNTSGSAITITLTAPGGYSLLSVERNAALSTYSVSAGATSLLSFYPASASMIEVYGVAAALSWTEEVALTHPHQVDGTGATMNTTASAATYGHATFSNSAAATANYVIYRIPVPHDFDSSVDMQASFVFRLGGADTAKHRYTVSMADVADSAGADSPTFSNAINLDFAGDGSGASGDRASVTWTTLTSWKSSLTAGHTLVIKLARAGDDGTNDTSTVDSTDVCLKLKIGHTQ